MFFTLFILCVLGVVLILVFYQNKDFSFCTCWYRVRYRVVNELVILHNEFRNSCFIKDAGIQSAVLTSPVYLKISPKFGIIFIYFSSVTWKVKEEIMSPRIKIMKAASTQFFFKSTSVWGWYQPDTKTRVVGKYWCTEILCYFIFWYGINYQKHCIKIFEQSLMDV